VLQALRNGGEDAVDADAVGGAVAGGAVAGRDIDAGTDAGRDVDVGTDAGRDVDAGTDAGRDVDAGTDAGRDVDAGTDAGSSARASVDLVIGAGDGGAMVGGGRRAVAARATGGQCGREGQSREGAAVSAQASETVRVGVLREDQPRTSTQCL